MEMEGILRNKYWVLRHGKSIPNERGIIVSSMENGTHPEFQLASEGISQAELAGKLFKKELETRRILLENVRICYSPFSRTSHTAAVVATVLNIPFLGSQCKTVEDLRERFFGPSFELKSHHKYVEVWDVDEKDPFARPEGGESVKDVACRLARAMAVMESEFTGCTILVVSHGDTLQILQTILNAANQHTDSTDVELESRLEAVQVAPVLSQHRKYALLTGELRCTILVVSHGDTLQILQTILNAANQHKDSTDVGLESRLEAVQVAPVLSQHRKYALLTGELREVI